MRKIWTALGLLAAVAALSPAPAQDGAAPAPVGDARDLAVGDGDYALGAPDAPVVLVEYASLTCPHCASFHSDILPALLEEYVETGRLRYVYRDFPLDNMALRAAMVARCSGRDRFFGFIEAFYASQSQWAEARNPMSALRALAALGGMPGREFDACMANRAMADGILAARLTAAREHGVSGTPTVFINGHPYPSSLDVAGYRAVIGAALARP